MLRLSFVSKSAPSMTLVRSFASIPPAAKEYEVENLHFFNRVMYKIADAYVSNLGYEKYGLRLEDLYPEVDEVKQALERLPEQEKIERYHRILRATDAGLNGQFLPEEQWTKPAEDKVYLMPIIDEIALEENESQEWDKLEH